MSVLRRIRLATEPVLWEAFAKSLMALFIGWPIVALSNARQGLLLGLYAAGAALVLRSRVTPNAKVEEKIDDAVAANKVEIHDFLNSVAETAKRPARGK